MKAILRSINNFSCKLKQSNNLKYNISPKIRSNKFKNISGNGNVIIEDALNKDLKDYRVYGNTVQSKLPSEYTQVDYIKSSDTQYINTNIVPTNTTKVEIKYQIKIVQNTYVSVFGSRDNNVNFFINNGGGNTRTYYWHGTGSTIARIGNFSQTTFNISTMDALNGLVKNYNNETEEELSETVSFTSFPNLPMYIFARNSDGIPTYATLGMKCWYMKIYDNNVLVRDFIPCYRNSDNEVGLYDLVNNVFYTNQGTGVFTYGSIAPTPDAPIDIVSCGDLITDSQDEHYGKYKIPINVRSENLFDKDNDIQLGKTATFTGEEDNEFTVSSSSSRTVVIVKVPSNEYVSIAINNDVYKGTRFFVSYLKTKSMEAGKTENQWFSNSATILTPNNANYIGLVLEVKKNKTNQTPTQELINDIGMVIKTGSTVPDKYIPYYNETTNIYLDEPLRGIDGYSDYIDFINGKIVRNIKKIVLDGSEDWYTSSGTSQVAFNKGVGYIHDTTKLPCNISSNCQMPNNNLYFYSTGYSLADWKTFLSITNAIVYGRLSTPTEEDIELPNINLIEGKNIITIGTEVQGVFEAEYYSKEIIDISNYKYNLRKVED